MGTKGTEGIDPDDAGRNRGGHEPEPDSIDPCDSGHVSHRHQGDGAIDPRDSGNQRLGKAPEKDDGSDTGDMEE